jgi:hypothetical protein
MNNTDKLLPRERVCLMNAIAERDKLISEKDRLIAHYKRQYEIAVRQRLHERHERADKWKDRLTGAVLAIAAAAMVWLTLYSLEQFWLWANGM